MMLDLAQIPRLLRSVFFEDLLLKLFCLVLAVLLWFYIDGELMDQKDVEVPLKIPPGSMPASMELAPFRQTPKFLVKIRGTRRRLDLITPENVVFNKRVFENLHTGKNMFSLEAGDLEAEGFEVLGVSPRQLTITIVATTSASKPVRVKLRGDPKPGFLVGQPRTDPAQVNVEVLGEDLNDFSYVYTEEVDIGDADQDTVKEGVAIAPSVDIDYKKILVRCNEKVRVVVPIRPVTVTRPMTFEVRAFTPPGLAMLIEPKSVEVEVVAEERDFTTHEVSSRIFLYVEWPGAWERPKDASMILGPLKLRVEASAPARVQVRGLNNGPLPAVEVRGAMAAVFKSASRD